MSRLENAPSKIEIARLMAAMVDQFCDSYRRAPSSITLDIDDNRRRLTDKEVTKIGDNSFLRERNSKRTPRQSTRVNLNALQGLPMSVLEIKRRSLCLVADRVHPRTLLDGLGSHASRTEKKYE